MLIPRQDMAFEYLSKEKLLVSFTGPHATADQWDGYIALMRSVSDIPELRFLVLVEGPPPSPAIQKRIAANVKLTQRVALVSSSAAMRFVVSAFSLVNRSIRFFLPDQVSAALEHVGCREAEAAAVRDVLQRVQFVEETSAPELPRAKLRP